MLLLQIGQSQNLAMCQDRTLKKEDLLDVAPIARISVTTCSSVQPLNGDPRKVNPDVSLRVCITH